MSEVEDIIDRIYGEVDPGDIKKIFDELTRDDLFILLEDLGYIVSGPGETWDPGYGKSTGWNVFKYD